MSVERDEMKAVLNEVLDERKSISESTHRLDHEFIGEWRDRELKRERNRAIIIEKIKAQVGGWFVIAMILGAGSITWQWFVHLINSVKNGGG